jgi:arsenate reductase-like glutaredoxin family protein
MNTLTFTATDTVFAQLAELSRITARPIDDLINELLCGELDQMIARKDTEYMRLVLDDVEYPDHATAKAVAENYNAINRALVQEKGRFHVRTAYVDRYECTVEFTESIRLSRED